MTDCCKNIKHKSFCTRKKIRNDLNFLENLIRKAVKILKDLLCVHHAPPFKYCYKRKKKTRRKR